MAFTEFILPAKRSRRSIFLPAGNHYIDFKSSPFGSSNNYFALLANYGNVLIAMGGYHYEDDPTGDPLPVEDDDFMLVNDKGHYEAQGWLFNSNVRVWIKAEQGAIIVY